MKSPRLIFPVFLLWITTCLPSTGMAELVHQYLFEIDGRDLVGGADATLMNGATILNGAVHLDGNANQYVDLPIGDTIGSLGTTLSLEAWYHVSALNSRDYFRVFDIGQDTSEFIAMSPRDHTNQHWLGFRDQDGANEQHQFSLTDGQSVNHLVLTFDNEVARVFVNGVEEATIDTDFSPEHLGNTSQNWLGRSRFGADPYLNGYIQEFNIYTHALSSRQVLNNYSRGTAVPEPASCGLIGLIAMALAVGTGRKKS